MFIRCFLIVTGVMLILTSILASVNADLAYAEGPYKYHKFPGPWEYEEDMVTVGTTY